MSNHFPQRSDSSAVINHFKCDLTDWEDILIIVEQYREFHWLGHMLPYPPYIHDIA